MYKHAVISIFVNFLYLKFFDCFRFKGRLFAASILVFVCLLTYRSIRIIHSRSQNANIYSSTQKIKNPVVR